MVKYLLSFLAGFLACAFLFSFVFFGFGDGVVTGFSSYDVEAPGNWVSEEDIILFEDYIVLRVANATLSNYGDTGSMKPLFDVGANGIRVVPSGESDVEVGDIVSFRQGDFLVVHRVVEKGYDEGGVYFVTQGDNNLIGDSRIRFEEIEYVTVGIIY